MPKVFRNIGGVNGNNYLLEDSSEPNFSAVIYDDCNLTTEEFEAKLMQLLGIDEIEG